MPSDSHEDRVGAENYILIGACFILGLVGIAFGSWFAYRQYTRVPHAQPVIAVAPQPVGFVGAAAPIPAANIRPPAAPRNRDRTRRRPEDRPALPAGWSLNQPEFTFVTAWPLIPMPVAGRPELRSSLAEYRLNTGDATVGYFVKRDVFTYALIYAEYAEAPTNVGEFIDLNVPPLHRTILGRMMGDAPLPPTPWLRDTYIHDDSRYIIAPTRPGFQVFGEAVVLGRRLYALYVECPDTTPDESPSVAAFFENFTSP